MLKQRIYRKDDPIKANKEGRVMRKEVQEEKAFEPVDF